MSRAADNDAEQAAKERDAAAAERLRELAQLRASVLDGRDRLAVLQAHIADLRGAAVATVAEVTVSAAQLFQGN